MFQVVRLVVRSARRMGVGMGVPGVQVCVVGVPSMGRGRGIFMPGVSVRLGASVSPLVVWMGQRWSSDAVTVCPLSKVMV